MSAGCVAYIGCGSNLEAPADQLRRAVAALEQVPGVELLARSPLYRSAPIGPPGQPDYVNAVVGISTTLGAHALLDALQALEHAQGRVRDVRWGPRTLDLDLLLYGEERIDDARLTVPHPRMPERAFVLYPLADIAPMIEIPGKGPLGELIRACPALPMERLEEAW